MTNMMSPMESATLLGGEIDWSAATLCDLDNLLDNVLIDAVKRALVTLEGYKGRKVKQTELKTREAKQGGNKSEKGPQMTIGQIVKNMVKKEVEGVREEESEEEKIKRIAKQVAVEEVAGVQQRVEETNKRLDRVSAQAHKAYYR